MKKFLCLAASAALLAGCSEKPGYEITGTVTNPDVNGKQIYMYDYPYTEDSSVAVDSALVQNGAFVFKGTAATPGLRVLVVPATEGAPSKATFVLDNAKMTASIGEESFVAGTPENDLFNGVTKEINQLSAELKTIAVDMKSEDTAIVAVAEKKYEELDEAITAKSKAYVESNTNKQTAAILFYNLRYNLNEDEQNAILAKADSSFKAVSGIDKMIDHLNILKNSAVGNKFINFEMADAKGKSHQLAEFVGNGKVVLIDFWASWCPPCRRDMPYLVKAYKDYKGKGFEIVGISLDSKADAWEKGVKDLGITWTQLSDLQGWKNAGAALYGVNSIPHTVLVDKDGTIIAKNIHGKDLDAKLQEVLK